VSTLPYSTPYGDWSAPGTQAAPVTPNDNTDLPWVARFLWIGESGDISVILANDSNPVTFKVLAGTPFPFAVRRVRSAGTTAGSIIAVR
jgi:hypothetical protein